MASEGNHSWSSGVLSVVGGSGTLAGSTCIGNPGVVAGWMGSGWKGWGADGGWSTGGTGKVRVPKGSDGPEGVKNNWGES